MPLDIDAGTPRKHFRRELDYGLIEATAKVAQLLSQMVARGKNIAVAIL